MDKKKILQLFINRQQVAINDIAKSMDSYKEYADLDEDDTLDPEDFSQQTVAKESQLRLQQQLNRAQNDLASLENFAKQSFDTVQVGALIETDSEWFLAGISVGALDTADMSIHCVSTASPAFEIILGKKINDQFKLGSKNYLIKSIA